MNNDDDGIGVLFRVQAPDTYYRFQMDAERRFRRLERCVRGVVTVLAEDATRGYEPGKWMDLEILMVGARLAVRLDGEQILAARDSALSRGGLGFYSFMSNGVQFDRLAVRAIESDVPVTVVTGQGEVGGGEGNYSVVVRVPGGAGDLAFLTMAADDRNPIDLSVLDPLQRLLPMDLDVLFLASLSGRNAALIGAGGMASFEFQVPPVLRGTTLLVGGCRLTWRGRVTPLATARLPIR
jgi:hypothetical protein